MVVHVSNPHNSQETGIGLPRVEDLSGTYTKTRLRYINKKEMLWGGEEEYFSGRAFAKLAHTPKAMQRKKWACWVGCWSSPGSPLLLDSEQEVPPGTTESVQSVDYYCDSECKHHPLTFMLKVDLSASSGPSHF